MATWLSASQYLQQRAVNHMLGISSTTMPSGVFVGVSTSDPGESGSFAGEPTGGGYGRQALSAKMTAFILATGVAQLSAFLQFPVASAAWGTLTHVFLADTITAGAGNVLWYGPLEQALAIFAGSSPVQFTPGQLKIEISAAYLTNAGRKAIGDHFLGKTPMPMPSACDIHLFKASPTADGLFDDEADYGDYTPIELTSKMASAILSGANAGISFSDESIVFPTPASGSNVLPYAGITDGAGSPTMLFHGPLRRALVVNVGDPAGPTFPAGAIAVRMT